jgi:hypothetical protein
MYDESDPKADEESESKHIRSVPDNLLILKAYHPRQISITFMYLREIHRLTLALGWNESHTHRLAPASQNKQAPKSWTAFVSVLSMVMFQPQGKAPSRLRDHLNKNSFSSHR